MRFKNRLAYSTEDIAGIHGFTLRPVLFPLIAVLLLALLMVFSGCGPQESTLTTPAVSTPATGVTPTLVQSNLRPPLTLLLMTTPSLSPDGLVIDADYMIGNPNAEKLELGEIKISTLNSEGTSLTQKIFSGAVIEASSNARFSFKIELPYEILSSRTLTLELDAQTVNTAAPLSVKSTSPLNISEILDKVIVKPRINLQVGVTKFTESRPLMVEAQIEGSISNPNPLALNFMRLELVIKDKTGEVINASYIEGGTLPGNSDYPFKTAISLPMTVFNQKDVTVYAYTSAQFLNNMKSFNSTKALPIPTLASLISLPEITFTVNSAWNNNDPKLYVMEISAALHNDNAIDFNTEGFELKLYNNASNTLLKSASTSSKSIGLIRAGSTGPLINTNFTFSSTDLGKKGFEAEITGDLILSMTGVNEKIPVSAKILYALVP